ncbi:hypothetical protein DFH06DRAFT_1142879 [Mycena polygramma]|nr:hypothetical protein DFH06DRAFT_1142879 [Mycena polygramma]
MYQRRRAVGTAIKARPASRRRRRPDSVQGISRERRYGSVQIVWQKKRTKPNNGNPQCHSVVEVDLLKELSERKSVRGRGYTPTKAGRVHTTERRMWRQRQDNGAAEATYGWGGALTEMT